MTWLLHTTNGWTDSQCYVCLVAVLIMVTTGIGMTIDLIRQHHTRRQHTANHPGNTRRQP